MPQDSRIAQHLALLTKRLLGSTARAVEDLTSEELHCRVHENANSIGFEAWHIARTVDNLIHFAFDREQTVWLRQKLDQAWNLPRVDQGTGMDAEIAHEIHFPEPAVLAGYIRDVAASVEPRIEAMDDDYLETLTTIRPHGELPRIHIIGQVIIAHGNNHLGQMNLARTLQGKEGLGF